MKRLYGLIRNNFGLKVVAVLFAILLWSYVVSGEDPYRERVVEDVPITIVGLDYLEENGFVVPQQYLEDLQKPVDVRLRVRLSETDRLANANIRVLADFTKAKTAGTVDIRLEARTDDVGVDLTPSRELVTVAVEKVESIEVPVVYEERGRPPANTQPFIQLSAQTVTVSGASEDLNRIARAHCVVDLSSLTETTEITRSLTLQDAEGNEVLLGTMGEVDLTATLQITVLPTKEVPLVVGVENIADLDTLPEGYEIQSVVANTETITLIAEQNVLARVESISIKPVEIAGATGQITLTASVAVPGDVRQVSPATVRVTITIGPKAVQAPDDTTP
ncbi:hypothetical protein LJC55_00175 [Eubacteriales bacterium OttesenSCG-928-N14]|nr:hypothetical protein [Eubacteriales bacterium OttesenSCG-928-N14]